MTSADENNTKAVKVVVEEKGDISSANGKIIVTSKGHHKNIHVVYFTENQIDRIFDAIEERSISVNSASKAGV